MHFTQKITAENITFSADFLVKYLVLLLELFWLTSNEVGDPYLYPTKKLFCGDPVTLGMTLTLAIPTSRKAQQVVLWPDFIRHFFLSFRAKSRNIKCYLYKNDFLNLTQQAQLEIPR